MKTYLHPDLDKRSDVVTQDNFASSDKSQLELPSEAICTNVMEKEAEFSTYTTPGKQVGAQSHPWPTTVDSIVQNVDSSSAHTSPDLACTKSATVALPPAPCIIKSVDEQPGAETMPTTSTSSVIRCGSDVTKKPEHQPDISALCQTDLTSQTITEDGTLQESASCSVSWPKRMSIREIVSNPSSLQDLAEACEKRSCSSRICDKTASDLEPSDNDMGLTNVVEDLTQRIERLLELSRPRPINLLPPVSNLTKQLSPRLPLDCSPLSVGTQDLLSTPESDTWTAPGLGSSPHTEFLTAFGQTHAVNGRRTWHQLPQRTASAPPTLDSWRIRGLGESLGYVECTTGHSSATLTTSGSSSQGSQTINGKGSLKRAARSSDPGDYNNDEGNDDEDRGRPSQRRRFNHPDSSEDKARHPCIFKIGEPRRFAKHTKRYQHISELL
jgi:hypothetical protein